ncbi:MAG: hypothetical protein J6I95_03470 [Anaerotignum sp.]|nr:hypothetical protein [Anaerotignum sp.]
MGLFSFFKKKEPKKPQATAHKSNYGKYPADWPEELKMAQAMQHFRIMMESVEIISKTVYCKTFFYRYGFAVENAQIILNLSRGCKNEQAAQDMYDILISEKVNIANDFLFRCYDAGKIQYIKKDIVPYLKDMPRESKELLSAMVELENLDNIQYHPGACAGLFTLLLGATLIGGLASPSNHSHYCDGDCANCPPHYGYRYGRWYYGHGHQSGCERGGNGGHTGLTYKY